MFKEIFEKKKWPKIFWDTHKSVHFPKKIGVFSKASPYTYDSAAKKIYNRTIFLFKNLSTLSEKKSAPGMTIYATLF